MGNIVPGYLNPGIYMLLDIYREKAIEHTEKNTDREGSIVDE
jgi:hypothetical protein